MGGGGAVGLFGKLPARRDYVQHGVEPRLMRVIDPWLQSAVRESRCALGEAWLGRYLAAPIWRFWLGPGVCGTPVLGALMPSVDGIGRYFPLCLLGAFNVPPPELDEQAEWFAAVEALMLAVLAEGGTYEALLAGLAALPLPRSTSVAPKEPASVRNAFAALRQAETGAFYDRCTCWWVPSPDGARPPRVLVRRGLPTPVEYAAMLAPDGEQKSPAPRTIGQAS